VVGAAAIGGSATKTISTIVITFEMLGQVGPLMIPVSIGLLTAYWCTTGVAMGIFDVIIEFKNFPYMPSLGSEKAYSLKAHDIMNKNFMYLSKKSTLSDIPSILMTVGDKSVTVPVVASEENKVLLFTITSASLKEYLFQHFKEIIETFDEPV
jgi:chloride channel 2